MSTSLAAPALGRTAATPRPHHGSVRLTRRGRMVVVALGLGLMLLLGVLLTTTSAATDEAVPSTTETIRVGSGDTLWDIASERSGDAGVQEVIDDIRALNAMDTAELQAGQLLVVPAEG
ncbi:LysM peptidoglycan-binding domain-containing protein [Nocardioides zeae]|uniref:LysM peptidoglycan-binding domain-containing protein n=1 Tax=Nocardioides imazamoxiresistens TaxID=3231893 RepID=A0ABU3PWR7_9ACTN|nr:LysM peptidoglycan-binding domain-containing protein [Nocardioides zeae]MDT9593678.1 LysM peptidoglycan-binding domain-containing protein [Nocardioides zeae]